MPKIDISDAVFLRLQKHAKPLIDTPNSVIDRAIDALEVETPPAATPSITPSTALTIDVHNLPDLTHTKVIYGSVDGTEEYKPYWNSIVRSVLIKAFKKVGDFDAFRRQCPINIVKGEKYDSGYKYLEEIGISYQGADANQSAKFLIRMAPTHDIKIKVQFEWEPRTGAAHPGQTGTINLEGK